MGVKKRHIETVFADTSNLWLTEEVSFSYKEKIISSCFKYCLEFIATERITVFHN